MCMFVSTYLYIIQTNLLQKQPTNISNEMNIGFVQSCPAENGKITFHLSRPCGCNPQMSLEELWLTLPKAGESPDFCPCPVEDGDITDPVCSDLRTHLSLIREPQLLF